MTHPLHRLLELRDPRARVTLALDEPVEPAIVSYYLELIGIDAGDRLVLCAGDEDEHAWPEVDLHAAAVPLADDAEPAATVRVLIRPDRAVQVLSAHDRLDDGIRYPASRHVDALYRYGARIGARLAAAGATGTFAIDFALDGEPLALGPSADDAAHAHATLLALRANAFRASDALAVELTWREALAALRAAGVAWNPVARAGVVAYGLESLEDTGELSLVALGSARTEAEERFYTAVTALGAVHAATTVGSAR